MLGLNLGHSPLYRHFYKCLNIEFYHFLLSSLPFPSHCLAHHKNAQWRIPKYTQQFYMCLHREEWQT